jgi:hypothetical protein
LNLNVLSGCSLFSLSNHRYCNRLTILQVIVDWGETHVKEYAKQMAKE